jgi:hypothetical protein
MRLNYLARTVLALLVFGSATATGAERGGSNYNFYHINSDCSRDQYGVIGQYDTARGTIDHQLKEMYANGQRRLRLVIFYGHGLYTGTVLDSAGGNFAPRYRANLAALLAEIKAIGYRGLDFAFGPQLQNSPWQPQLGGEWPQWREDMYQEHWHLIENLRPIFVASGLPYHIDLLGEAIPTATQPMYMRYTRRMWAEYTRTYGKSDTVGFSIIPAITPDRIAQMRKIYGDDPPPLFDLHMYHDAYSYFTSAHERLARLGYGNIPWIIGETYYNDARDAKEFAQAIKDTGQKVLYLYQWPLTRKEGCQGAVDVPAPLQFNEYTARGF